MQISRFVVRAAAVNALVIWLAITASALGQVAASDEEAREEAGEGAGEEQRGDPPEFETVVTPSRSGQSVFDVDRNIQRIGKARLDAVMPIDVPDALDEIPGVSVQRTNRGAGAPIIRGLIGPQNLLLIDGLRFNQSIYRSGPLQYLALVDPNALDSVEVLLGPGSVLYGSNAMGGVVNMLPLGTQPREGWFGRASARFASADLGREVSATGGGNAGWVSGWLGGSFRDHGELRVGSGDKVLLSDYRQGDWRGRVNFNLGDGWTLGVTYLGSRLEGAGRVDQIGLGDVRIHDNEDHFTYLDVRYFDAAGWLRDVRLAAMYHRSDEVVRRTNCIVGNDKLVPDINRCASLTDEFTNQRRHNRDTADTVGGVATARAWFFDGRLQTTVGGEAYMDFISSSEERAAASDGFEFKKRPRGNFSDGSRYLTAGAFVYLDGRPLVEDNHELVLTAGARLEHVTASASDVPGVGDLEYSATGAVFSGGVRYLLMNRYNFYFNFSQGWRPPNLQETTVLGDTGSNFEVPNGNLKAERSNTYETGMRMFTPWLDLTGAYFYTVIDDVIDREDASAADCPPEGTFADGVCDVSGKKAVKRNNAASATFHGTELGLRTKPLVGFSIFANLMYVWGEVEIRSGKTEPYRRIPPFQGTAGVAYASPDGRIGAEWYAQFAAAQNRLSPGDKEDLRICGDPSRPGAFRATCEEYPGWFTMGVRGRYSFDFGMDIFASVDNIMDANYRILGSGLDAPGVNGRLGVRYVY